MGLTVCFLRILCDSLSPALLAHVPWRSRQPVSRLRPVTPEHCLGVQSRLKPELLPALSPPSLTLRIDKNTLKKKRNVPNPDPCLKTKKSAFCSQHSVVHTFKKLILTEPPQAPLQRSEVLLKVIGKKGTNGFLKELKCRDLEWDCGERKGLEDLSAKGATVESIVALKLAEKNHFWFSIEE